MVKKKEEKMTERHYKYPNGICYLTLTKTRRCEKHNKTKTGNQGKRNDLE